MKTQEGVALDSEAVDELLARFEGRFPDGWNPADTCRRFLSARRGDAKLAADMLEASLAWRESFVEGGVATLLHYQLENELCVRRAFPQAFHKLDRYHRPVQYFVLGDSDLHQLMRLVSSDALLRWSVHRAEHTVRIKLPCCSEVAGHPVISCLCIVDLDRAPLHHLSEEAVRTYMHTLFKLLGENYPGNLAKIFVINCPLLFSGMWAVVRLFLPEADRERAQLLGGPADYEPVLAQHIEPQSLPTRYGGADETFSVLHDVGPWESNPPARPLLSPELA